MKLRFLRLDPAVDRPTPPGPDDVVAWFTDPAGSAWPVPWGRFHPFDDLHVGHLRVDARAALLEALARPVRSGRLVDQRLDLSFRFAVQPDRDDRPWVVTGYRHVLTVDRKLLKHVLGAGADDDDQRDHDAARWSEWLGHPVDWRAVRDDLVQLGCDAWLQIASDPQRSDMVDIYGGLQPSGAAHSMARLATLRERFMEAVRDTVADAGCLASARHVHLDGPEQTVMHFLDDRGLNVICKGSPDALAVATAFSALEPGQSTLTPSALGRRRVRLVHDIVDSLDGAAIHSPNAWGF